jgi:hypothetical protein
VIILTEVVGAGFTGQLKLSSIYEKSNNRKGGRTANSKALHYQDTHQAGLSAAAFFMCDA